MNYRIFWSAFAENEIDSIFEYHKVAVNTQIAKRLVRGILNEPKKLLQNPYLGQIEVLLRNRQADYRYILYKNYKIIYAVDVGNKLIKIADVFDTRQNPKKIIRLK